MAGQSLATAVSSTGWWRRRGAGLGDVRHAGGTPDQDAAALAGHTVVHLHGGLTPAAYDGWAENLFAPGQDAVFHYPMGQRAALHWYHDHVMGVTKSAGSYPGDTSAPWPRSRYR